MPRWGSCFGGEGDGGSRRDPPAERSARQGPEWLTVEEWLARDDEADRKRRGWLAFWDGCLPPRRFWRR